MPDKEVAPLEARTNVGRPNTARRKLPTILADHIVQTILERDLRPGARLQAEHEMIEEFGVGRATVREALRLLEAEGLITMKTGPGGGPMVGRPDLRRVTRILLIVLLTSGTTLRHVYGAREVLDPLIAALAATYASEEQRSELSDSLARMEAALSDEEAVLSENGRFHRLLAESSGNPVLLAYSVMVQDILDGFQIGIRYSTRSRGGVLASHRRIVEAVLDCDPGRASQAAARHVGEAVRYFERKYAGEMDAPIRPSSQTDHFPWSERPG